MVEIPNPDVILGVVLAFLGGMGALYAYHRVRPHVGGGEAGPAVPDGRLEYYERQLIDMKIRLDAMELQGAGRGTGGADLDLKAAVEGLLGRMQDAPPKAEAPEAGVAADPEPGPRPVPGLSPTDHVLRLITDKAMTSRDIQVTLGKSREHTSRLMKRLFEDGLVERSASEKPYRYSITQKGRARAGALEAGPVAA